MPKAGAPFMLKIFWISKWNESTGKKDEPAGKRMNLLKKKMNLQEKGMNQQERKEWEALCIVMLYYILNLINNDVWLKQYFDPD